MSRSPWKNERPISRHARRRCLVLLLAQVGLLLIALRGPAAAAETAAAPELNPLRSDPCFQNASCESLYNAARRASKEGDLSTALELYQRASAWVPTSPSLRFCMARILDRKGQASEACTILRQLETGPETLPMPLQEALLKHLIRCPPPSLPSPPPVPAGPATGAVEPAAAVASAPVPLLPAELASRAQGLGSVEGRATPGKRPHPAWQHSRSLWSGLAVSSALLIATAVTGGLVPHYAQERDSANHLPGMAEEARRLSGVVGDLNIAWPSLLSGSVLTAGLTLTLTLTLGPNHEARLLTVPRDTARTDEDASY